MRYVKGVDSELVVLRLWETLGGEQYGGFLSSNLLSLVEAIEGTMPQDHEKTNSQHKDKYKLNGELKLLLSRQEGE